MKMERDSVWAAEGGRGEGSRSHITISQSLPCLPHFTDREMGSERGGKLPVTPEDGRKMERWWRGGR